MTVGTVTVRFQGTANVSEQIVRANMQVREGGELDDTMIDRDIRSILDVRKPRLALPSKAADCHCHVFGPREKYPWAANRLYTPPPVTLCQASAICVTMVAKPSVVMAK